MRKRTDGRYKVTFTIDGKRKYLYGRTRQEAHAKLDEAKQKIKQGHRLDLPKQTVAEYLDSWLASKRRLAPSTQDNYELNIKRLKPHIGHIRLDQLRAEHIDAAYTALLAAGAGLRSKKGLSKRSVHQCDAVIRQALSRAVKTDLLPKAATNAVEAPKAPRSEMKTLDEDQVQCLWETTQDHWLHALWVLLPTAGLRIGEATALRWSDVDFEARRMHVQRGTSRKNGVGMIVRQTKTERSTRPIELGDIALEALKHHRDRQKLQLRDKWSEQGLIFPSSEGTFLDKGTVNRAFQNCLAKAHIPRVRVHDLRHTCATLLLKAGTHPKVVQELLGHSTIGQTMNTYSHVIPSMHRDAADTMDSILSRRGVK